MALLVEFPLPGVEEAAVLSTEAGGLEAGKLRVCAGRGCVGSAILEDTEVEAPLFAVEADDEDCVLLLLLLLLLLLAIC